MRFLDPVKKQNYINDKLIEYKKLYELDLSDKSHGEKNKVYQRRTALKRLLTKYNVLEKEESKIVKLDNIKKRLKEVNDPLDLLFLHSDIIEMCDKNYVSVQTETDNVINDINILLLRLEDKFLKK